MFKVEDLGPVVRLTLQSAPVNAISSAWLDAFQRVLDGLEAKRDLAVLHLRSDQKVFCAGADLADVQERFAMADGAAVMVAYCREIHRLFDRIEALPYVTLAEIGGSALGGGLELALACDLRIAGTQTKLGLPETRLGLIPGAGGTQRLTRLCGPGIAARIILSADVVDGATARELGMVQWAVPAESLSAEAEAVARRVAGLSAPAVQVAKRCMAMSGKLAAAGFEAELEGTRGLMATPEAKERIAEFFAARGKRA